MAKQTRYSNREPDEERRPAGRTKSASGAPIVPLAILIGMIVGAVILARSIAGKKDEAPTEAAQPASAPKPFANYEEEAPKPRERSSSGGGNYPPAPAGLADSNPDWARALSIGAEAKALYEAAQAAKQADQTTVFIEKANAAKAKFDEAFTLTAVWEDELLELYGGDDRQVSDIVRARTKWSDALRVLHKSTPR